MSKFQKNMQRLNADESGATAIEYGLIAAGIALSILASLFLFGGSLSDLYDAMEPAMVRIAESITP